MTRAYGLAVTAFLTIASGGVALGQAPKKPVAPVEDIAALAAIMDHVWLDAAHNRDSATLQWLFADDFVEVHPGGDMVNKQQQIDQIMDPSARLTNSIPMISRCATRRRTLLSSQTQPQFEAQAAGSPTTASSA
jgi:hypothetical protein